MNLRNIDLNLLVVFDTVYALRSNTRAAEKLGLTQSAVSNALKRLRAHLGDPLFERRGQDFVPTAEADRLAPVLRKALASIEQSIDPAEAFDPSTSDRTFSLVLPDATETVVLPPLIRLVRENGLGVRFRTAPLFGIDIREALLAQKIDLAFLPNPFHENGISSAYLYDEEACVVCRADHPVFGGRETLTLEDMSTAGIVSLADEVRRITHMEHEMRARKINRDMVCIVSRMWSIPHIVATTDLIGALSRNLAEAVAERHNLKIFDLPLERPVHHWHMIWHENLDADPAHAWLRERISELCRD